MDTFFAFLSLAALLGGAVGLIRPGLVMPSAWKPGRLKALALYAIAFFALAGIGMSLEPPEKREARLAEQTARQAAAVAEAETRKAEQQRLAAEKEAEAARAKAEAEKAATERIAAEAKAKEAAERAEAAALAAERGKGIGVGRMVPFLTFQQKYDVKPSGKVGRLERWMGQSGLGIVELLGAEDNLTAMTVMIGVVKEDLTGNLTRLGDMHAALMLIFPKWTGSKDWLVAAFSRLPKEPKQEIVKNGLRVSLSHIQGMGLVSLTIDSRDRQSTN